MKAFWDKYYLSELVLPLKLSRTEIKHMNIYNYHRRSYTWPIIFNNINQQIFRETELWLFENFLHVKIYKTSLWQKELILFVIMMPLCFISLQVSQFFSVVGYISRPCDNSVLWTYSKVVVTLKIVILLSLGAYFHSVFCGIYFIQWCSHRATRMVETQNWL